MRGQIARLGGNYMIDADSDPDRTLAWNNIKVGEFGVTNPVEQQYGPSIRPVPYERGLYAVSSDVTG